MREIHDPGELAGLCGGDTLCVWAAQGLAGSGRAWAGESGRAVAVAGPGLSARDRLAVYGPPAEAVTLVRSLLPRLGPTYRPLGDPELIDHVVKGVPSLVHAGAFAWMETGSAVTEPQAGVARWLGEDAMAEITSLLDAEFPGSYARPGVAGVERWAGVRDRAGRLVAVAALGWSAPSVGLLVGVAVRADARGLGAGGEVCRFVLGDGLARHGTVALMVDAGNLTAIRLYRRLGLGHRPMSAARVLL